jgi:ATF/CREB family transcription factor
MTGSSAPASVQSVGKRGTKRKSTVDNVAPPPAPVNNTPKGKRTRADANMNSKVNRRSTTSPDGYGEEEEEEDDDEDDDSPPTKKTASGGGKGGAGGRGSKVPMTEEEKRKNFLERNRQGLSSP